LGATADLSAHGLQVRIEATIGAVVGVTDAMTKLRPLAADLATFRHLFYTSDENYVMKAKPKFNTGGARAVKPILRRSNAVSSSTKVIFLVVILSSLLALSCKGAASSKESEVVAKVGSHDIKLVQIDTVIKQQLEQNGGGSNFTPAELAAARLSALENLIQEEALFQRAQKDTLVPDDAKLNQEIQKQKQDANLTEDQFKKMIEQSGLTETEWRDQVRRTLAINALRDAQRARVTQPTDAEIEKYYADHQAEFRAERGVDIAVIVTDPANNGTPTDAVGDAQAEQKIKAIYERLKGGLDFATIAMQESEDSGTASRGGSLGFATEAQLKQQIFPTRPEIPARLMTMNPGQYTEPIKDTVSNRWYIIKVNQKLDQARNLTLADVRANIINSITQQRQGLLLNALVLVAVNEAGVKNYLAERIVQNPQTIVEMRPSQLLQQASPPQSSPPRVENQNQPAPSSNRPAPANSNNRPATANANR
jgi:peptidyl-prolyl cis-trans isomerase SurA